MAKSTVSGLTVTIGADTKQFANALKQLDAEARNIAKDLKTVNDNLKLDPSNSQKTAQSMKLLQDSATKAAEKVKLIQNAIDKLNKEYSEGKVDADDYNTSLSRLKMLLSQAKNEQDLANEKIRQFGRNAEDASGGISTLASIVEGRLLSDVIRNGFNRLVDLVKSLVRQLVEAGKELVKFSANAVKSAAEFKDAIGYSETVYGEMSEASLQWAKDNSEGLRISEKTLVQYMNTLGQVFHSQGMKEAEALDITESLMKMAADLRAATGMTTDEILPVMMRGFTTSVKNFRQFGVIMTDAEVKAYALANGLAKVTVNETDLAVATAKLHDAQKKAQEALTKYGEGSVELEKAEANLAKAEEKYNDVLGGEVDNFEAASIVKARFMLLSERLKNIEGQNTNEAKLLNSQLALLKTKYDNLVDTIGLQLLPVVTDLVTKFNEFLSSEEGQAILQQIVDQFKEWAKAIAEMVEDGRLAEFLNNMIDNLPKIVEAIGKIVEAIIIALPYIADMTDEVLQLFGIKSENQQIKEAFIEVEDEIAKAAKDIGIDTDLMIKAIHAYAEQTGTDVLTIYQNWQEYQPKVSGFIQQITTDANGGKQDLSTALSDMTSSTQTNVESQISFWDRLKSKVHEVWIALDGDVANIIGLLSGGAFGSWSIVDLIGGGIGNLLHRAGGGRAYANMPILVGDDAQRRPEIFVPDTNGTILSGDQTEKVLNNINNSRTVGDVNIYLNSYGADATSIANEIGIAVQQKLRMSGAMLY